MNLVKTTTLAIGASLIGSLLFIVLAKPDAPSVIILAMGVMLLIHGTGFLQEYVLRSICRWYRTKKPVIGIINDLPWPPEKGIVNYRWAWSKMNPEEWHSKINSVIKKSQIKGKSKLIKITKPWTRWFLDRYLVIINPYGSLYPEIDIENLTVMRLILHYVHHGGMFVNVADIPFFFPHDPDRKITYCPTAVQPVHIYKALISYFRQIPEYEEVFNKTRTPFAGTPFLNAVMADVIETETRKDGEKIPMSASLKLKDSSYNLENVIIHRGILCIDNIESLVEELLWEGKPFTPLCYVHFGKSKFLFSLIFLEYDKQPKDIREKIINLQCDLVIKEVRDTLRN